MSRKIMLGVSSVFYWLSSCSKVPLNATALKRCVQTDRHWKR